MMKEFTTLGLVVFGLTATSVMADDTLTNAENPKVLKEVIDCERVTEPMERLGCYDRNIAKLKAAQAAKEIYVADREQIKKTQKGLFGFNLPKIRIFADDDADEVQAVSGKIVAVREGRRGWVFELEDGAVWGQTDSREIGRIPKAGQTLHVRRAAMGSYMAKIDTGVGFRAERLNTAANQD